MKCFPSQSSNQSSLFTPHLRANREKEAESNQRALAAQFIRQDSRKRHDAGSKPRVHRVKQIVLRRTEMETFFPSGFPETGRGVIDEAIMEDSGDVVEIIRAEGDHARAGQNWPPHSGHVALLILRVQKTWK